MPKGYCGTCCYWNPNSSTDLAAECRWNAPTVGLPDLPQNSTWQTTQSDDWCGQYSETWGGGNENGSSSNGSSNSNNPHYPLQLTGTFVGLTTPSS